MRYVVLPNTDLRVSRLAFGTGSLHHVFRGRARRALLEASLNAGITHFDTSPYYGLGMAESDLAPFIRGHHGEITISTKVGIYGSGRVAKSASEVWLRKLAGKATPWLADHVRNWAIGAAMQSLNDSLQRLHTDHVDMLLLHEPEWEAVPADEFLEWLWRQRKAGKIRYWGIAGTPMSLERWVAGGHGLAQVVQTQDSVSGREADRLARYGAFPQLTYGYLSSPSARDQGAVALIRAALRRNEKGTVIFSTRRLSRIAELAVVAS